MSRPIVNINPVVAKTADNFTIIKRVAIRASYPSRLKYSGAVSGEEYEWSGAGDVVMVLAEDVSVLLEKRIGKGACCGAVQQDGNQVFELVEGG